VSKGLKIRRFKDAVLSISPKDVFKKSLLSESEKF
jgi:hypothetical protein